MKHYWEKATLNPEAKDRNASILPSHFYWGPPSSQGGTTPKFNDFGIIFLWMDKGHVVINSATNIWISNVENSRNVDLTGKQHSGHQQFWRFPLSPLEASSRLPRSRDHIFSHSMSKASLPEGPDMWYLTFYENKVLIIPNPNLLLPIFQILTLATFVRNCGAKPECVA